MHQRPPDKETPRQPLAGGKEGRKSTANLESSLPQPPAEPIQQAKARLGVHPLAMLLPDMSSGERIELQRDIKKHGLRQPIILYGGRILDGRHRYAACIELGVTPWTTEYKGDDAGATSLVLSLNLHRRHLNQEQKRELVNALLKADPTASDRSIARAAKVDNKTVAAVRRKAEDGEEIPHHAERVGSDGVVQPAKKAGGEIPHHDGGQIGHHANGGSSDGAEIPHRAIPNQDDAGLRELNHVWKKAYPKARMLFICSRRHEVNALLQGDQGEDAP